MVRIRGVRNQNSVKGESASAVHNREVIDGAPFAKQLFETCLFCTSGDKEVSALADFAVAGRSDPPSL